MLWHSKIWKDFEFQQQYHQLTAYSHWIKLQVVIFKLVIVLTLLWPTWMFCLGFTLGAWLSGSLYHISGFCFPPGPLCQLLIHSYILPKILFNIVYCIHTKNIINVHTRQYTKGIIFYKILPVMCNPTVNTCTTKLKWYVFHRTVLYVLISHQRMTHIG